MNLTSREGELRQAVYSEIDNSRTKHIREVFVSESDNGLLAQVVSNNSSYTHMLDEMTSAVVGLCDESDTVNLLYVQPSTNDEDRVAEITLTNEDFGDMSEAEQRLQVAHSLRLK